ncbi:MAG: ATP-binding protein [Marinifilum sp.]|jgi:ABC-type dipeptide/oligopeptide/nickel transport system ATPase component|nr:ATP-binding protein [Marinifilum sp.]
MSEPIKARIQLPLNPKIQQLPFEQLSWELFEELCLKVVQTEFDRSECEKRGIQGQNQDGIDIFAKQEEGVYSVYQCKKYRIFGTADLKKVISRFQEGKYYANSNKFYICTSCDMNSATLQDEFEEYRTKLHEDGIELYKWDKNQLSGILKAHPRIVYDIFGPEFVKAFNGDEALSQIFPISEEKIYDSLKFASGDLYGINNEFSNLPNSHIKRNETTVLNDWIHKELQDGESNIAILAGDAGTGKSVILRDLVHLLNKNNIPVLGLKADRKTIDTNDLGKSILDIEGQILDVFKQILLKHNLVVVIVDQIDALSRSLSTKRNQLEAYGSLINNLSMLYGLRIIVSCRIFDLNYEPEFKQFTNKKVIKLSLLSEKEVSDTLNRLTGKEQSHFPKELLNLLKTPLHLDVFCKIYNHSTSLNEIKSLQDLYRNLWNVKIKGKKNDTDTLPLQLESVMYQVANQIYDRQENLSVPSHLFDNYHQEISYLTSENLIVSQHGSIQFFHQSFFDYTYSRNFVESKGGDIFDFLVQQKHQGLFIRSITKQVLAYLRIFNPRKYIQELENLFFSNSIRYHIKLLIIEQLAFEEKPKQAEFKLVLSLVDNNKTLLLAFLNSIPRVRWFKFLANKHDWLVNLYTNGNDTEKNIISRLIVFEADEDIDTAFQITSQIKDKKAKVGIIKWMLFRAKDYSKEILTNAYFNIENSNLDSESERFHILTNAIKSNPDFAICESRKVFDRILSDWKKQRKRLMGRDSDESTFFRFCKELCEGAPDKAYVFVKEIVSSLIEKTTYERSIFGLNVLSEDEAFKSYQPDTYLHHETLGWLIEYLKTAIDKDFSFVQNELADLIQSNSATQCIVALQIMHDQPDKFKNEIFSILTNQKLLEDFFLIKDLIYYYRELLRKTYLSYSSEKQNIIKEFILKYFPKRDFHFNSNYLNERKKYGTYNNLYPFPFWGHDQWLLLKSLPPKAFQKNADLSNRLNMFSRRYDGWKYDNQKPNHHITMASVLGGIMSSENYEKLSPCQWLNSFTKLEDKGSVYQFNRNYSIEEHARAFKKVVQKNSGKFYSFVKDIISLDKVHIRYQTAGVEGLIGGEYDISKAIKLYKHLMNRDIPDAYMFSFIKDSKYFIKNSVVDEDLINYWQKKLESPFNSRRNQYIVESQKDQNDVLFSEGWSSINSWAIELIIRLSDEDLYTERIYNYLLDICNILPIQLRLVVLYHLNNKYVFSNKELLVLFELYTKNYTPEFYHVAPQLIHDLIYHHFDQIVPFLKKSIKYPAVAKSLGVYLLYGWYYGQEKSKELLLELHNTQPSSIKHTIDKACEYLNHSEYAEKSLYILKRYSIDKRKEVREGYSRGFLELKSSDLPSILNIIIQYISDADEERLFNLYSYLKRCVTNYSSDCITILNAIDFEKTSKTSFEIKEPIKLLILCYNAIREYDLEDENLEFAMDTLDKLLQQIGIHTEIDDMLKELDTT